MEYYSSKENVQSYIKMAKGHSGLKLIEQLDKFLAIGSNVLELGSGPGTDWELLNRKYKVTGSDNSIEFLNHLKLKFPDGKFLQIDAVELTSEMKFDAIYSNKVLHHLKTDELEETIKRQSEILNDNGLVCHSFWLGEGDEYFKGMYVNYHTEAALETLFEDKFEVLYFEKYPEFEADDSILVVARKK